MPQPDEDPVAVPPSPPLETNALRPSCPPDEERLTSTRARADSIQEEGHTTRTRQQVPTPEPDTPREDEKGEHIEDTKAGAERSARESESPSPVNHGDAPGDWHSRRLGYGGVRKSERKKDEGEEGGGARYLTYPPLRRNALSPYATTSFLRPGSKFKGTQQSDRQVYDVQVEIKDVNLAESYLCGYLRIQGLTDDHPTLTTFFHSELIGPHHAFLTTNPTLHSTPKIDLQHWSRFPPFRAAYNKNHKLSAGSSAGSSAGNPSMSASASTASTNAHLSSAFTLEDNLRQPHLFMRWKELFLVPDHRVKSISGASFEGFYYICFDQRVGSVSGIYFHARSEKFQQLELQWVRDGGCGGVVEFR